MPGIMQIKGLAKAANPIFLLAQDAPYAKGFPLLFSSLNLDFHGRAQTIRTNDQEAMVAPAKLQGSFLGRPEGGRFHVIHKTGKRLQGLAGNGL